jgi:hypothetical protein
VLARAIRPRDSGGGIFVQGMVRKIDQLAGRGRVLNDSKFAQEGNVLL